MNIYFYDLDNHCYQTADAVKTFAQPVIGYTEQPVWALHFVKGNNSEFDLSECSTFRFSINNVFSSNDSPMMRCDNTAVDAADKSSGILRLTLDGRSNEFLSAVNGKNAIPAYLEIWGYDGTGVAIWHEVLNIKASGAVDAALADPPEIPELYATAAAIASVAATAAEAVAAAEEASAAVADKAAADHTHTLEDITDLAGFESNAANQALDNITSAGKMAALAWITPDMENVQTLTAGVIYTATVPGWAVVNGTSSTSNGGAWARCFTDALHTGWCDGIANGGAAPLSGTVMACIFVPAGCCYQIATSNFNISVASFIPCQL